MFDSFKIDIGESCCPGPACPMNNVDIGGIGDNAAKAASEAVEEMMRPLREEHEKCKGRVARWL